MKKHVYISILAIITAAAALLGAGCMRQGDDPNYRDEDCFEKYMENIAKGDYEAAYQYVASDLKSNPGANAASVEGQPQSAQAGNYVLKDEFIKKHTDIFSALGVKSVTWNKVKESVSGSRKTVDYNVTYDTAKAGVLKGDYRMNLKLDGSAWRVDWSPALIFPEMTWGSTVRVTKLAARRGDILCSGRVVALTADLDAVYVEKDKLADVEGTVSAIGRIIDIDAAKVIEKIGKSRSNSVTVGEYTDGELTADMREALSAIEGVGVLNNSSTRRDYPYGSLLAHTLGYVGYATEKEIAKYNEGRDELDGLYTFDSIVGKSGLEQVYETILRGKDGYNVTVRGPEGELTKLLYRKPAEDGMDVNLTVDLALQQRTEELLDLVLWGEDTAGAVVVMDPTCGAVKAIASYPTYDLNTLSENYNELVEKENSPLFNRTTQGLYPPGSAFKVFTATAAMETGTIASDYVFTEAISGDYWTPRSYGRWVWPPIKRAEVILRATPLNMENGLIHSDNIYFADLALKMGEEKFFNYLRSVGMEKKMPFELNVATSTIKMVGDDADETQWNLRSIAETGYGQGQVTMTPLQLAAMYCAFRNSGDIPQPYVTDSFFRTEGTDYDPVQTFGENIWIPDAITPYSINVLTPMLEHVVSPDYNGTGRPLRARNCTVAGKTGTAEKTDDKTREISWFVGFRVDVAPEDELLVLVVLEVPTSDEYTYLKFDIARELISIPDEPRATELPEGMTP